MPAIREEGQPEGDTRRHLESSACLGEGPGRKAGGDWPGVVLLGLRYPPPEQMPLLLHTLPSTPCHTLPDASRHASFKVQAEPGGCKVESAGCIDTQKEPEMARIDLHLLHEAVTRAAPHVAN